MAETYLYAFAILESMKSYRLLLLIGLLFSFSSQAQELDLDLMPALQMRSIGPAGMSGRVTSIDAVHSDPKTIYIGTASGGVWKSDNAGTTWTPIFDKESILSIGAVAIQQSNPSVVWAGTGEGNPRNSHNSGKGIYKTINGGRSWTLMGLEETKGIHRIVVTEHNPDIVYVAATGSAWGNNPQRGVFRTRDGGQSWEKVLYVNDSTGCADLVVDPENPNKIIAAMWDYGRKPWTFRSGGPGSGLYISYDGGDNWKKIEAEKAGLPKGDLGRIGLAISASSPNVVYAWIEAKENALYRSDDGGHNWKKRGTKGIGNRPFYYADIFVDPANENRIYSIYSMISRSEDGGKNWQVIVPYSGVHPDHHALWINPNDPDHLINGNDGGLNISYDRGKKWRFVENLPLGQFYHIRVDRGVKPYNIYGGMQDNGSWAGPAYVWQSGGIRNENWQEVLFGDGFDVLPDPENNRYGYAMWQGGGLARYDRQSGRTQTIIPQHPEEITLRFHWNAAIAEDPFNSKALYYGSQFVHYSTDQGNSWKIISPDLTTNDSAKQQQHLSGGLTIDDTEAENHTTILSIAPSSLEKGLIWVGTDDGHLQITRDGGENWTEISSRLPGFRAGSWIPQIHPSTHNAAEVFVVVNDYRRNHWDPYLYHSNDYGASWTRIVDQNDVNGHALSIVQDPKEPKLLFLGTDAGLWFSINYGKNWMQYDLKFPAASTRDLTIHEEEHDLIVGTFGRAAWVMDDLEALSELASSNGAILKDSFHVFKPATAVMPYYKQPPGVRFDAHAGFRGQNRRYGAGVALWINPVLFEKQKKEEEKEEPAEKKSKKKKKDSSKSTGESTDSEDSPEEKTAELSEKKADKKKKDDKKINVWVCDINGDTLRHFKTKADTGLIKIYWDMRTKGTNWPSWDKPKNENGDPTGWPAQPGTYTLHFDYKGLKGSTELDLEYDPRHPISAQTKEKYLEAETRIKAFQKAATDGFERLRKAETTIKRVESNFVLLEDSVSKELRDAAKPLKDSIKAIQKEFISPKDFKGIDGATYLNDYLWRAMRYLEMDQTPNANALYAIEVGEAKVQELLDRINNLMSEPWNEYRTLIEESTLPLFEDWEAVEISEE